MNRKAPARAIVWAPMMLLVATMLADVAGASMDAAITGDPRLTTSRYAMTDFMKLAASSPPGTPQAQANPDGAWRLMRSRSPLGGPDALSIVHTVDISRSDADLAGMMLRCAPGGIEALVIVFDPRPPGSRPWVKVRASGAEEKFEAKIVPPFTALLLPAEAVSLLTGRWRTSDELAIEVEAEPLPVKGILSLIGLGPALDGLRTICPPQ